jgi:hypothetical protein
MSMADSPGTQTPPTDPKSQDKPDLKTGPVRPPVLEGTARTTSDAKSASANPATKPASPGGSKPEQAKVYSASKSTEAQPASGAPWLAALLGGAIGLGAAYGLAWFGLWPSPPQTPQPADPRLAQFGSAIPELQSTTGTLRNDLTALGNRLTSVEAEIAALPTASAAPASDILAEDLAALTARFEALATTPAATTDSSQADNNAEAIAALEAQLTQLQQSSSTAAAQLAETQRQLSALTEATDTAQGDQSARLPLIFSGLESAFASGRSYETELSALRSALPGLTIPETLSAAANGLPRPDEVAQRLNAAIPDMLAGRPPSETANWQDGAMDWVRGIVAMRPTGDIEGDAPDAQIARLEAAIARRDFAAARTAFIALPAPMQAAAGSFADDITRLSDAQTFIAQLRDAALRAESGL